jgi:hypothetical protein
MDQSSISRFFVDAIALGIATHSAYITTMRFIIDSINDTLSAGSPGTSRSTAANMSAATITINP